MKVGFVKSFKVSGSTMADILLRISYFSGVFFDIVTKSIVFTDFDPSLKEKISEFNILIQESWNIQDFEKMLGNDAIYTTILRNPVHQFESMFSFIDMREFYNVSCFEEFMQKLELGTIKNERFLTKNGFGFGFGKNQQSYSLGLETLLFENTTAVDSLINKIKQKFHLVMISEYFDESVILLKNLLGTSIGHMLYVKQIPRKIETVHKVTEKETKLLEKWLEADMKLYNTFKRELENQLSKRIKQDVDILREFNSKLQSVCKVSSSVENYSKNPSERFGMLEIERIRSHRSNLLCDLYIGDHQRKFMMVQDAVKTAGEVQRIFMV